MIINKFFKSVLMMAVVAVSMSSCVKEDDWSTPEVLCNNKFDAPTTTMADFAALAPAASTGLTYKVPTTGPAVIFDAYVVSSDESGNFYKTISFQDKPENPTVGLQIEVDKSSNYLDFPVGSHIRIKANGLVLGWDRGAKKIGSVDPAYAIGRIPGILINRYVAGVCNGNNRLDVAKLVPTKLATLDIAKNEKYINTLVNVSEVQFKLADPTKPPTYVTYVAGVGQDTDRDVESKNGSTVVRNSGFSTFGSNLVPVKSGDLTFVVSRYNANFQMLIRNTADVNFNNERLVIGTSGGGVEATTLFFQGADFENWNTFLGSLNSFGLTAGSAVQGIGTGRDNSNSFYLNSTPSANIFVFTTKAEASFVPAAPKKITFWVKGSAAKSLSMNVETTAGRIFFNLENLNDKDVLLQAQTTNQYTGVINTNNTWRLVTLDLTGKTLKTTGDLFAIKAGSGAKYDLVIDNIKID